ncbi:2-iminoacetate synthase ThiH [Sphingobacterium sp. SGL-16]|uniref:2-iminoacetate synthase ThiH n=1 Tax=Sphingobacterium sp. SGL-16 TaxID=2710883 RepID=UPI0013ECE575|nr:2-iminoacetate synthase ThiH [Sphingobacterium sp. SGL-16]NGM72250.1 2-iminoacetate synthase ThiH [Sphingobacterium sp. SGL-16]
METFLSYFHKYKWDEIKFKINNISPDEVKRALDKRKRSLEDFLILLSPEAADFLPEMANQSQLLARQRFGKTIQLFAPLYLSNECQNICTYCGFSLDNKIKRKTLSNMELLLEASELKSRGIDHVLLVSGEANHTVGIDYFLNAVRLLKPLFSNISLEVQPLEEDEYRLLNEAGVHSILVYQETYHQEVYKKYHPKGKKSNFEYRLETPDRIGRSKMHKIGLGVLLGLEDWRVDSFFNALHLDYLQKKYWQTRYTVSFPRLRPAEGVIKPNYEISDQELLQLICAYRIWNPDLELSISTRESEYFRDNIIRMGITSMSAASKTNPGGYVVDPQSLEQFEISDERSVPDIITVIQNAGYEAVLKDWESIL